MSKTHLGPSNLRLLWEKGNDSGTKMNNRGSDSGISIKKIVTFVLILMLFVMIYLIISKILNILK